MNKELLIKLSSAFGPSGFEDPIYDIIKEELKGFDVKDDNLRNIYINDHNEEFKIMLDAHSDEVGLIIQSIKENGLMKFLPLGGWIPASLVAQKVKIRNNDGKYITGVISSKPPHFMSEAERKAPIAIENMFIDVGATSKKEVVEQFNISIGAPVVPATECEYNEINDTFVGKAFDNRVGTFCLVEAMKLLKDNKHVVGAIASQEEVGTRGAKVTAAKVKPNIAIVLEGTPADDGFKPSDEVQGGLRKGPQLRHFDRVMITNPRFVKFAREIAMKENLTFQDAIRSGGGTNAGPIHLSNEGVPTIVIGVPTRYIHSHYSIVAAEDVENTIKWIVAIVNNLTKEIVDSF